MTRFILTHPILSIGAGVVLAFMLLNALFEMIDAYNQTRPRWPFCGKKYEE